MSHRLRLHGIYVPLVTPFAADGTVALDALERLARDVLADGAAGLVALGTTGEPAALTEAEKAAVVDVCARVCAETGAQLIVGAAGGDTRSVGEALAALGGRPEVTAALVSVPGYTRPGEAGVLAHFAQLAAAGPVPIVVYHIPYRTGQPLSADALRQVGALPNVAAVKFAAGAVGAEAVELLGECPPDFAVLAGDDIFLAPLMALGARGGVLASAHLATARFVETVAAWDDGDLPRARQLGHAVARVSAAAFAEPNPAVVKGALHALGRIPTPDVRLPLLPAGEASVAGLLDALKALD